jgi:uncharacterized protein (DUF2267 family)
MSATGLEVFDQTLQKTNIWLDEIVDEIGPTRQVAWHVLGAVLRTIRGRVPVALAAHLGAQLPLLIRGAYYDQFRPSDAPSDFRTLDGFLSHIADGLKGTRPVGALGAAHAVMRVLSRHVDHGQIEKIKCALPEPIRRCWEEATELELETLIVQPTVQ